MVGFSSLALAPIHPAQALSRESGRIGRTDGYIVLLVGIYKEMFLLCLVAEAKQLNVFGR